MADDRKDGRQDEEETKVTVRDRRRVSLEGELREVDEPTPPPPPAAETPPPAESAPPRPAAESRPTAEARPGGAPKRGGALGGAEEARVRPQRLREVPAEQAEPAEGEDDGDGAPRVTNIYEYVQVLASQLMLWSLASLGLMPHPATRLISTDMDQAQAAVDAAEALLDSLADNEKAPPEMVLGGYQSFVIQYGQIAAQILNQPPQTRLAEISKVRFCIDTADHFFQKLQTLLGDSDEAEVQQLLSELTRFLQELRLVYVQSSGGGGIIG